jgi:hypothetical protein
MVILVAVERGDQIDIEMWKNGSGWMEIGRDMLFQRWSKKKKK